MKQTTLSQPIALRGQPAQPGSPFTVTRLRGIPMGIQAAWQGRFNHRTDGYGQATLWMKQTTLSQNEYRAVRGLDWMQREVRRVEEMLASGVATGSALVALRQRVAMARERLSQLVDRSRGLGIPTV